MVDLTNKELLIPIGTVYDMTKRAKAYKEKHNTAKFNVYVDAKKVDYVTYDKLKEMYNRTVEWKNKNGNYPDNVWINKPKESSTPKPPIVPTPEWKNNSIIKALINLIGDFNTFTEYVEKMRAYAKKKGGLYKYYLNSRFLGTNAEIKALTQGLMGNCVDWSQLSYAIAKIMGYNVEYIQFRCTNVTHICIRVQGKEFSNKTVVDLAAIVDANSSYYAIGEHWCSNTIVSINAGWLFE
ncbi:MAG: hypothetical protein ACRC1M_08555 [Methanobacteriaceae archaeon]